MLSNRLRLGMPLWGHLTNLATYMNTWPYSCYLMRFDGVGRRGKLRLNYGLWGAGIGIGVGCRYKINDLRDKKSDTLSSRALPTLWLYRLGVSLLRYSLLHSFPALHLVDILIRHLIILVHLIHLLQDPDPSNRFSVARLRCAKACTAQLSQLPHLVQWHP